MKNRTFQLLIIFAAIISASFAGTALALTNSSTCTPAGAVCDTGEDMFGTPPSCLTRVNCPPAGLPTLTQFSCETGACYAPAVTGGGPSAASCPSPKEFSVGGIALQYLHMATDSSGLAKLYICGSTALYTAFSTLAFGFDGSISNTTTGPTGPVRITDPDGLAVNYYAGSPSEGYLGSNGLGGNPPIAVGGISNSASVDAGYFGNTVKGTAVKLGVWNTTADHALEVEGGISSSKRSITGVFTAAMCVTEGGTVVGADCMGLPLRINSDGGLRLLNLQNNIETMRVDVNGAISNQAAGAPVKVYDTNGLTIGTDNGGLIGLNIGGNGNIDSLGGSYVQVTDAQGLNVSNNLNVGNILNVDGYIQNIGVAGEPVEFWDDNGISVKPDAGGTANFAVNGLTGAISNPGALNLGMVKFDDGILTPGVIIQPIGAGGMTIDTNTFGGGAGGMTIATKNGGITLDAYGTGGFNFAATRGAFENNGSKVGRPAERYPVRVSDGDGLSVNGPLQNTAQFPKQAEFTATGNNVPPYGTSANWDALCVGAGGTIVNPAYDVNGDNKYCEFPLRTQKDLVVNGNLTVTGTIGGGSGGTYTNVSTGGIAVTDNNLYWGPYQAVCPAGYKAISCTFDASGNNQGLSVVGAYEGAWGAQDACFYRITLDGAGSATFTGFARCWKP